jgi:dTMP kinase
MGFQSAKIKNKEEKKKFLEWLEELEFGIFNIPKPDIVIYLYAPYKISQKMVDQKGKRNYTDKKRDIHERNRKFLAQVEKEYIFLARTKPEWRTIVCTVGDKMMPPEEISKRIFALIEDKDVLRNIKTGTLF